jgi:predicted negative regulator of RcsB-dependent stress response
MKNFIEVASTEEEQIAQVKKWIKDNSLQIVIGIVLGVGGVWGFNAYNAYQATQAQTARNAYLTLVKTPNIEQYNALTQNHSNSGYAAQATLIMAKNAVGKKEYKTAIKYLSGLSNSEDVVISSVAKLRVASVFLEIQEFDSALNALNNIPSKAFSAMFSQLSADIYFAKNELETAKEHYQLALSQAEKNSSIYASIQLKLNDLN